MTWHCAKTETPEVGRRIVALYDDGGGSNLFFMAEDDQMFDCDGFCLSGQLQDYHSLWAYLPDDFLLWCERRSKNPLDFSKIKQEGER